MELRIMGLYCAIINTVEMDDIDRANLLDTLFEVPESMVEQLEHIYMY